MSRVVPIQGYEGIYEIDETGVICRIDRGERSAMRSFLNKDGYLVVTLCRDNTARQFRVHRLVAISFLPNPYNLPEVHHKDENKINPHVSNLEWCTRSKNMEYSFSKEYTLVNPSGEVVHFRNLNKFCRDNNLNIGHIHRLFKGQRVSSKGWKTLNVPT